MTVLLETIVFAVVATGLLILLVFYLFSTEKKKGKSTIPGPDIKDEKEGNLPDIAASGSLHEFLRDMHGKYGPIVSFWFGEEWCVSIASPQLFKEQANNFDRPEISLKHFLPLSTADSFSYTNGKDGRMRHSTYSKCFSHENVKKYFDVFQKLSQKISDKWASFPKEEHIPLGQYMFGYAFRSLFNVAFGTFFRDEKQVLEFNEAYNFIWSDLENRLLGDMPDEARMEKFEKYKSQMMDLLLKAAEVAKSNPKDDTQFVEVVQRIGLSINEVKADMISMAVSGLHTTGYLLTWCIYFLATHAECQERVYEELEEVLADNPLGFEAITKLKYLRQVLDETLRCSVLTPYVSRYNMEMDTELGGYKLPAGTPVIQALGVLYEDKNLWPDPGRFDPDRFSDENRKKIPSYGFEPFGFAGKRKCPGYRLGILESTVLVAELLRRFKINLVDGQVVDRVHGLVTKPKEEIWITLEKRKQ